MCKEERKKMISMTVKCLSIFDYLTLWESDFSEQSYSMVYGSMGTQQYSEHKIRSETMGPDFRSVSKHGKSGTS